MSVFFPNPGNHFSTFKKGQGKPTPYPQGIRANGNIPGSGNLHFRVFKLQLAVTKRCLLFIQFTSKSK